MEAPGGQRINISLIDFTGSRDLNVRGRQYGYIMEMSNMKNISVNAVRTTSGANLQRESAIFVSDTNGVNVVLLSGTSHENYTFLIKINGMYSEVS